MVSLSTARYTLLGITCLATACPHTLVYVGIGFPPPLGIRKGKPASARSPGFYRIHLDVATLCEIDWYADGPSTTPLT